jgi:hypothetical protein
MRHIAQQRNVNHAQPAVLSWDILPMPQRVLRIDRCEDDAAIAILEFVQAVLERENLSRTNEAEGRRDEEQDEPGRVDFVRAGLGVRVDEGAEGYV